MPNAMKQSPGQHAFLRSLFIVLSCVLIASPAWSAHATIRHARVAAPKHHHVAHVQTKPNHVVAKTEISRTVVAPPVASAVESTATVVQAAPPTPPPANPYLAPGFVPTPASAIGLLPQISQLQLNSNINMVEKKLSAIGPDLYANRPQITTIHPLGGREIKVVSFACPAELFGVSPAPVQEMHVKVNAWLDVLNSTHLLPYDVIEVCRNQ